MKDYPVCEAVETQAESGFPTNPPASEIYLSKEYEWVYENSKYPMEAS